MRKDAIQNITKALPDFFKTAALYVKSNFEENGQEILGTATGTAALVTKLLAKPLLDKYFDGLAEKKLTDFGFKTYLKASLEQASFSLLEIEGELKQDHSPDLVFEILNKTIAEQQTAFNPDDVLMIFSPRYHPAQAYVKKNYKRVLTELGASTKVLNTFLKHFNEHIEAATLKEFGDDYDEHMTGVQDFLLNLNEEWLLWDTVQLGRIGFKEDENLKFETTYGQWKRVSQLRELEGEPDDEDEHEAVEEDLKPVKSLIDAYFDGSDNNLQKILFIVADFGKGKSVFMKQYASELARKYIQEGEGSIPVYFNLRNFKNYSSESSLGVLADFLLTDYGIDISDDHFSTKPYVFLVDSLDESGDLNKTAIQKVIASVKNIQNLDKVRCRTNKVIITTRPFDDGLQQELKAHEPQNFPNREEKSIPHFINVYGFKKEQFNDWLYDTLKGAGQLSEKPSSGFVKEILTKIGAGKNVDVYEQLLKNGTLSSTELRRPIFAYMIYQLILNGVDFVAVGKIGVYLSFLNLLTKEAKHIDDAQHTINLKEEFESRTILHATAALWMYQRQNGKQGVLKKADICRTIKGSPIAESDEDVMDKYRKEGVMQIQFLSHSYFGEEDNVLHFQHQSFAEILLAEYYLKIFIMYALDEDTDIEEARARILLGEPTEQTVLFLKEMLLLLRASANPENDSRTLESRKLLFPLMCSLSIKGNKRFYSETLHYNWYNKAKIEERQSQYPPALLENWCIKQSELDQILTLAATILNAEQDYLMGKGTPAKVLYGSEILAIQNKALEASPPNIDRWLALLVGNALCNDFSNETDPMLFNSQYQIKPSHLFQMIKNWNHYASDSAPNWGKALFQGVKMTHEGDRLNLDYMNFRGIGFSHSIFLNLKSYGANWMDTILDYCSFNNVSFRVCWLYGASFSKIIGLEDSEFWNCQIGLSFILFKSDHDKTFFSDLFGATFRFLNHDMKRSRVRADALILDNLDGFLEYGVKNGWYKVDQLINDIFEYETPEVKDWVVEQMEHYRQFEKQAPKKSK